MGAGSSGMPETVASARDGGPGEASEASIGVAYGFLMEEKTRRKLLCLQQRREEQAPQATLTARRPTENDPPRGLQAHNTSRPKGQPTKPRGSTDGQARRPRRPRPGFR